MGKYQTKKKSHRKKYMRQPRKLTLSDRLPNEYMQPTVEQYIKAIFENDIPNPNPNNYYCHIIKQIANTLGDRALTISINRLLNKYIYEKTEIQLQKEQEKLFKKAKEAFEQS